MGRIRRELRNTGGEPHHRVETMQIVAWGPDLDGLGAITEIQVVQRAKGCPHPVVLNLSPARLDELLTDLEAMRTEAWPNMPPRRGA
jgi:hypothetical protein